jgi:protein TonB
MVPLPRPVAAATHAAQGTSASNGAAAAGISSGAGGSGNGTGAGGSGEGEGSGGEGAEWTKGRIKDSDYPEGARQAHAQGTTSTVIAVGADGRPTGCTVRHSSGNGSLDAATCALIMQRFRFRPAHDEAGRLEPDQIDYEPEWSLDPHSFE